MAFDSSRSFKQKPSGHSDDEPSAKQRTMDFFGQIEEKRSLNAYVTLMKEQALERSSLSDQRRESGAPLPLDGLPIAIKDNFCTSGTRTTAGSRILSDFIPTYESHVTQKLLDAGAVFLGKTNMDEFGMGSSTEKSMHGPTLNPNVPINGQHVVPGGSSGGSAAAVAADLALAAIGSDTGGSLRQPAAFCGVVGFKPTYGYCSRWGVISYASSLDQPGTITKAVKDAALLLDVIVSHDERDSTSLKYDGPSFVTSLLDDTPRKFTVGVPVEFSETYNTEVLKLLWDQARTVFSNAEIELVPISLPHIKYALPAYYIIALSEASSNLARYDGMRFGYSDESSASLLDRYVNSRTKGFGKEVRRRILLGTYALSSGYYDEYYLRATKVRRKISEDFVSALQKVDALVWPTAPTSAFDFGLDETDPLTMYLEDIFTVPVNLVGSPAISVPIANCDRGLPLGIQIVGPRFGDTTVLQIASRIEAKAEFIRPCAKV